MNTHSTVPARDQRGVVSIFIVLFSALLLSVITIGFIRTMIQDQTQASDSDLSQSAYDSAVAGVEDGKRALYKCSVLKDATACDAIRDKKCDTVSSAQIVSASTPNEVEIRAEGSSDVSLDQAYTCVIIDWETPDATINLPQGKSVMIPLKGTAAFSGIRLQWMHRNVAGSDTAFIGGEAATLGSPALGDFESLPPRGGWASNAASLLRTQTILPTAAGNLTLSDIDGPNVSTAFLRPGGTGETFAANDLGDVVPIGGARAAGNVAPDPVTNGLKVVTCSASEYANDGYACRATLQLPVGESVAADSALAYIRLSSLYRDTSVKIEMLDSTGNPVNFNGVQPTIDSTGRASNLFRRISSRVSLLIGSSDYPEYGVDITNSLCKDYYVTIDPNLSGPVPQTCTSRP